jgi:hypothetical protein
MSIARVLSQEDGLPRVSVHLRQRRGAVACLAMVSRNFKYVDVHTILALPEATGREPTPENFHLWSPLKGITVLGMGDFTPLA